MIQPKTWDKDEVLDLVRQWRERPLLWDVQHKKYRDQAERLCAHKELAAIFQATPGEIVIKLHDLRAQYNKSQKDHPTGGQVKRGSHKTTMCFDIMHDMFGKQTLQPTTPEANCVNLVVSCSPSMVSRGLESEDHIETSNLSSAQFGDSEALEEDLISLDEFLANEEDEAHQEELLTIYNESEHNELPKQENDCLESMDSFDFPSEAEIKSEQDCQSEDNSDSSSETDEDEDNFEVFGDYVAEKLRNIKSPALQRELKLVIQKEIIKYTEIEHRESP